MLKPLPLGISELDLRALIKRAHKIVERQLSCIEAESEAGMLPSQIVKDLIALLDKIEEIAKNEELAIKSMSEKEIKRWIRGRYLKKVKSRNKEQESRTEEANDKVPS